MQGFLLLGFPIKSINKLIIRDKSSNTAPNPQTKNKGGLTAAHNKPAPSFDIYMSKN